MADLIVILAAVTAVSLIAFMGILFIGLKEAFLRRILMALVGFAYGSLIGGAFLSSITRSISENRSRHVATRRHWHFLFLRYGEVSILAPLSRRKVPCPYLRIPKSDRRWNTQSY